MMLAIGSLASGAGILLVGLLALFFRHPRAPRWTRPEIVAMLVVIPVVGLLGFGFGHLLLGISRLLRGAGDPAELAVLFGTAIVVAGLWHVLGITTRLRAYEAAAAANVDPGPVRASPPVVQSSPGPTASTA